MTSILVSFTMAVYGWNQSEVVLRLALVAPFGVLSVIFTNTILFRRFGQVTVIMLAIPCLMVGSSLLMFAPWSPTVLSMAAAFCFLGVPSYPALFAFISQYFHKTELSQAIGILEISVTLAFAVSYPTFAALFTSRARGAEAAVPMIIGNACNLPALSMLMCMTWKHRGLLYELRERATSVSDCSRCPRTSTSSSPDSPIPIRPPSIGGSSIVVPVTALTVLDL